MTHQDPHYTKSSLSTLPTQIVSKTATNEVNNDEKCLLFSHLSTSSKQSSSQLTKYPNIKPVLQAPAPFAYYVSDPSKGTKLQCYQREDRIKSYTLPPSWEGPVDPQLMAEAGFVYTGQEDLVSRSQDLKEKATSGSKPGPGIHDRNSHIHDHLSA